MALSGLAALALVATACGSSSLSPGANPGTAAPTKGGTLNMLGVGDVDFMDYNIS